MCHSHCCEPTFSLSYGSNLQSSFARDLSNALVYPTNPPVSVYGTDEDASSLSSFSCKHGFMKLALSVFSLTKRRFPYPFSLRPSTGNQCPASTILLHPCVAPHLRCRNINLLAIDCAFRPRLRFRLTPRGLPTPGKPLVFGGRGSHPSFATYVRICSCLSSSALRKTPSPVETMLPYHKLSFVRCFGDGLEPR